MKKLFFIVWALQIFAALYTTSLAAKMFKNDYTFLAGLVLILYFGTIIITPIYTWVVRQRILDLEYRQENLPDIIKAGVETKVGELK